jgi:dienelactone hydrolase
VPTYAPNLAALLDREPMPVGGVVGSEVDYSVGGLACRGYLARPDDDDSHPGVLILHDWLGVTDYVRMRADLLARLGYTALAADVYGADVRPPPSEAPAVAGSYYGNRPLWRERVTGGFDRLLAEPSVDRGRTAAIGYCFGGSGALELARTGADLAAVVSFHGALPTGPDGEARQIRAKLLVLRGAIDPVVPDDAVTAFEDELRQAPDLDWQLTTYSGAMHAFTLPDANSPDHGAQFNAVAERRSWQAMKAFLAEALARGSAPLR